MSFKQLLYALLVALAASISGIAMQYGCFGDFKPHIFGLLICLLVFVLQLRDFNKIFKIYCLFFCLSSIAVQLHYLQMEYKLCFLKEQRYLIANVLSTEKQEDGYSLTLEINSIGMSPVKFSILKVPGEFNVGDCVVIKPARLIFLNTKRKTAWLMRDKNLALTIAKKWGIKLARYQEHKWPAKLLQFKEKFQNAITNNLSGQAKELFASVFLGKKTLAFDAPIKESFCVWGLSHFLARSGLHVAIFVSIVNWIFSLIPILPIHWRSIFSLLLLVCYSMLSWASISFTRAFSTFCLVLLAKIFNFATNALYLLTFIALFIILNNPFELLCVDFQLSFSLTFALILASKLLSPTNKN